MTDNRKGRGKKEREQLAREARELARSASRMPGVAELVHLYAQHAETVRRTQAYRRPADKMVIIASGSASA